MSDTVRFSLPLVLIAAGLSQWWLKRAKDNLSVEDKARLADATFRPWWVTLVFAGVLLVWMFVFESVPRQWHWASLAALMVAIFVVSGASAVIQWRSLVGSGVAQSYVRTKLWVSVVLYSVM